MGKQSLDGSLIILCLLRLAFVHCDVVNDFPLKMSPPTRWHSDNKNRGWTREAALQKGFFTVPHPPPPEKIKQIPSQTPLHPQEVLWIVKCPSESGGLASASGSARESRRYPKLWFSQRHILSLFFFSRMERYSSHTFTLLSMAFLWYNWYTRVSLQSPEIFHLLLSFFPWIKF